MNGRFQAFAVIQIAMIPLLLTAANGQKRTLGSHKKTPRWAWLYRVSKDRLLLISIRN